jgi:hypothetical protein
VKVREGKIKVGCCIVSQSIFKNVHVLGSIRCLKNILINIKMRLVFHAKFFFLKKFLSSLPWLILIKTYLRKILFCHSKSTIKMCCI